MKLKTLSIVLILATIVLPSALAQFQSSETNYIVNESTTILNQWWDDEVLFCCGRVSNVTWTEVVYGWKGYTFTAENVICILLHRDRTQPLFHRFSNDETLAIPYPSGIIADNYIFAFAFFNLHLRL